MSVKTWGMVAALALAGGVALAGSLVAQEKEDVESRVRVLALGQGSYLGVYISDVGAEDVDRLGLRGEHGVLVTGVADEGPARDAGLQEDDVIVSWNGERLESEAQLRRILGETPPGRSARLGLVRGGSERSVTVELGDRGGPDMFFRSGPGEERVLHLREQLEKSREHLDDLHVKIREMPHVMTFMAMRGGRLGIGVQSLEGQLADYFGLDGRAGVLVTTVREDSPAAAAGLKAGDVITAVDGRDIESTADLMRRVHEAEAGPVAVRVLRDRQERTLTVELPEAENTWTSEDGEMNSFFFGPEAFDMRFDFDTDDVRVEWAEPLRELSRIELLRTPDSRLHRGPVGTSVPARRALSI